MSKCTCTKPKKVWLCIQFYDTGVYCLNCDKKVGDTNETSSLRADTPTKPDS